MANEDGYRLTKLDFVLALGEQMRFLQASAKNYDEGDEAEAKRLASVLRTLLHSPGGRSRSVALLEHLGILEQLNFMNTAAPIHPANLISSAQLTQIEFGPAGMRFLPRFMADGDALGSPFKGWWGQEVIKDTAGSLFTRRNLVLVHAENEGGAHVDRMIPPLHAALSRDGTLGWHTSMAGTERRELANVVPPSIRQIAFEVETTLVKWRDEQGGYDAIVKAAAAAEHPDPWN